MNVVIIYNPNSTGGSEDNAKSLAKMLRKSDIKVKLRETQHAGHGEEMATSYAKKNEDIILISSSGDGGYHEVVNGVLAHPSKKVIVGVLPSGNANDHYNAVGGDSLAASIRKKKFRYIDTIKVTAMVKGKPWVRYAHSYVGIGVTAVAAKQLTVERPNLFTEKWIVIRSLFSFRYVKLREHGHTRRYSSMIFGNIDRMSKVMQLSEGASITDGKMEMTSIRLRSKFRLIAYLLTAATVGLKQSPSMKKYEAETVNKTPVQLDGEVYDIDANSRLVIESVKQNLYCVA